MTTAQHAAAFEARPRDASQHLVEMRLLHHRDKARVRIIERSGLPRGSAFDQHLAELVVDRLLHQQARTAQADLTGVLERGAQQDIEVRAPVAVGEHERRILAAQFQRRLLGVRRGLSGDAAAHRGAAGERHRLDGRRQHQRLADCRSGAVHDVQHLSLIHI